VELLLLLRFSSERREGFHHHHHRPVVAESAKTKIIRLHFRRRLRRRFIFV